MSSGDAVSAKVSTLSKNAKVWHYFIRSRLIPSSHLSDVTKDRAILIFFILTDHFIDIGGVMHASICHSIWEVSVGLYFPSFTMAMCRNARVIWGPDEEILQLMHAIDCGMMKTIKSWDTIGIGCTSSTSTPSQPPLGVFVGRISSVFLNFLSQPNIVGLLKIQANPTQPDETFKLIKLLAV